MWHSTGWLLYVFVLRKAKNERKNQQEIIDIWRERQETNKLTTVYMIFLIFFFFFISYIIIIIYCCTYVTKKKKKQKWFFTSSNMHQIGPLRLENKVFNSIVIILFPNSSFSMNFIVKIQTYHLGTDKNYKLFTTYLLCIIKWS